MEKALTVAQLIEKLREYPQSLPVFGTYEGVVNPIVTKNFYISDNALLIDVEQC